jgi:hypothetical protein
VGGSGDAAAQFIFDLVTGRVPHSMRSMVRCAISSLATLRLRRQPATIIR